MAKGNKKKKTMPVTAREVGPQNRPAPEGQPKAKTKKPGEPKAGTREVVMTKQQSKDPDAEPVQAILRSHSIMMMMMMM